MGDLTGYPDILRALSEPDIETAKVLVTQKMLVDIQRAEVLCADDPDGHRKEHEMLGGMALELKSIPLRLRDAGLEIEVMEWADKYGHPGGRPVPQSHESDQP